MFGLAAVEEICGNTLLCELRKMSIRPKNISISYIPQCDTVKCLHSDINTHLHITLAKDSHTASLRDYYLALSNTIWERLSLRWLRSKQKFHKDDMKVQFHQISILEGILFVNGIFYRPNLGKCYS